jgi:hypothetical protein
MTTTEQRPYRFGPRDARGLVLGVRPAQAAIVAISLIVAVGALRATEGPGRFVVIAVDLVAGLSSAFVPVRGRTLGDWVPVATTYLAAGASGRRRVPAPGPHASAARRPSTFAPFSIVEVEVEATGERRIGAVVDRRHGTLTGGLVVSGAPFALFDDPERERAVTAWSAVLSAMATSPLAPARVQWIERTVPDRRQALRDRVAALLASADTATIDDAGAKSRASYAALVEAESVSALCHETIVAVSVRSHSRRRAGFAAAVTGQHLQAAERLVETLGSLEERLSSVGYAVSGALSATGIAGYLDRTFRDGGAPVHADRPWPIASESHWAAFRTDALLHSTYWIAEWPRSDVSSAFLLPLLQDSGGRRTITVVMEPVNPSRATKRAEHARTSARADSEIRLRHGFSQTARASRQHDAVIRREEELASGHAAYRFSGYVTVSAPDATALERSCARVEQAAALARLELRRLFGSQAEAFCCTLPVGRGCG